MVTEVTHFRLSPILSLTSPSLKKHLISLLHLCVHGGSGVVNPFLPFHFSRSRRRRIIIGHDCTVFSALVTCAATSSGLPCSIIVIILWLTLDPCANFHQSHAYKSNPASHMHIRLEHLFLNIYTHLHGRGQWRPRVLQISSKTQF